VQDIFENYITAARGKNQTWVGSVFLGKTLFNRTIDADWEMRFNLNIVLMLVENRDIMEEKKK
jgi:hypothetical protein